MCMLSYLLMQSPTNARNTLKVFDSSLGQPLPEKDYAVDCRLYTPENCMLPNATVPLCYFHQISEVLFDEFVLAHFLGWFGKALLFRDWTMCWAISWLFEVLEVSLQHVLDNFNECWWDHLIVDVFVCNLVGMALGMWYVKKMNTRKVYVHSFYISTLCDIYI